MSGSTLIFTNPRLMYVMGSDDEEEIINCIEVQTSNIAVVAVAFARCRIYEM